MKKQVLYFHAGLSSFVVKDIEILKKKYDLLDFCFQTQYKKKIPVQFLKQFLFLIRHISKTRLIVCQFAGHHSFLPILFSKLFFKKSVIIAGGTDCVSFPSIRYGNFYSRLLAGTTAFSFKRTSLILPVHDTLMEYDYSYQPDDFPKQGYKFFVPGIKTPGKTVLNGYDSEAWYNEREHKQEKSFVTVGSGLGSRFGFQLKGIDLIFELAPLLPDCTFYIIGGSQINREAPKNVKLLNNIPNEQLRPLLSDMQFYLQLSMSEGFPNALSEAMLCECIPIVSAVGGMPDIVGSTGYILQHKDVHSLYEIVQTALADVNKKEHGKQARNKIKTQYTIEQRQEQLLNEISHLIPD